MSPLRAKLAALSAMKQALELLQERSDDPEVLAACRHELTGLDTRIEALEHEVRYVARETLRR
jgi:hypothetical protein